MIAVLGYETLNPKQHKINVQIVFLKKHAWLKLY